ncbi:MAG: carbamoyltransferase HypF [Syntrophorhabdaceae bacterium]|nr:carbamoyltransferase HypF [Syntrophorhabdaceae bacterium]
MDRLVEGAHILKKITIRGVVQGVGFRPFIYRLATEMGIKGWVANTSSSVKIEAEGEGGVLSEFIKRIRLEAPSVANIVSIKVENGLPKKYLSFEIRKSRRDPGYQILSPDIATCPLCLKELFDNKNRRYLYPFINCTYCGPRFTIIKDIPYDRPNTTMAKFVMCEKCLEEYKDPLNRRFHAQPNSCHICGPEIWIEDNLGNRVKDKDPIGKVTEILRGGSIVAIKGLGGFQLACDATDSKVVLLLRRRKVRPDKPFAVMMRDIEEVKKYCFLSEAEARLLTSHRSPIVILLKKEDAAISPMVAPDNRYLGVMLPYTPIHHLIMEEVKRPVVMTSGNISEEPIAIDNGEARSSLSGIADYFLMHNRDICSRYDDSVYMVFRGEEMPLRRARGYAPYPVSLPFPSKRPLLALGAQEKNTFCLTKNRFGFVSQHIGDLDHIGTLRYYRETIELYKRLFRIHPELIVHDLHPDYLSTRYAYELGNTLPILGVQHHHAHIVSCMIDNGLKGPAIGVAFDGSGFGTDTTIWGGEFLVVTEYPFFERMGRIEPMPLPGGDISIKRPYRTGIAYLYKIFGYIPNMPFLEGISQEEIEVIKTQIEKSINTPITSSCGRLFDAVSALLNLCKIVTLEAQAAVKLEMVASKNEKVCGYPFTIYKEKSMWEVALGEMFEAIITDIKKGKDIGGISFRFHRTVAEIIRTVVSVISEEKGIRKVVLSGGSFQNRLLLHLVLPLLEDGGFECFTHRQVPCNDGGISLGQAGIGIFSF